MISAILLAAGESRRMRQFKQLLQFSGKSFVEHCVDNLLESRVDEVIVVTGHRDLDVRRAVGSRSVRFAHNADYRLGMTSSVKCGVESLSAHTRGFVLSLVDQPQIGSAVINLVLDEFIKSRALVVVPTYNSRNGHPILMDIKLKREILELGQHDELRKVVRAHSDDIAHVAVSNRAVLEDFDLPEDYERVLKR